MHDFTSVGASVPRTDRLGRLIFIVAALQTGFGPFIVVYLTGAGWSAASVGWAVSTATVIGMLGQVPAGLLVARLSARAAAAGAIATTAAAAALVAAWPATVPVLAATAAQGFAGCVLGLALNRMTLEAGAQSGLTVRFGRTLRMGALGNAVGAAVMGVCGTWIGPAAAIWLAALLCLPGLGMLRTGWPAAESPRPRRGVRLPPGAALRRPGLAGMLLFAFVFQLANAALMMLAAAHLTSTGGQSASLVVAACIVAPQLAMALLSPLMGRAAERWGRRRVLTIGLAALPLRAALLALGVDPVLLVAAQALDGVSGGAFGLLVPLKAADMTLEGGSFTVAVGTIGVAASLGAAVSTAAAGSLVAWIGLPATFTAMAAMGAVAVLLHAAIGGPAAVRPALRPNLATGPARARPPFAVIGGTVRPRGTVPAIVTAPAPPANVARPVRPRAA